MGRLKAMPSRLSTLGPALVFAAGDAKAYDRKRDVEQPWRAWYRTSRWQKLRQVVLVRDLYTCKACGRIGERGMVVDHVKPHRGSETLFWDEGNLQVLCASPCHSKHKQALEQSIPSGVWD